MSESTSVQDISIAPGSPGEQGVSFSAPSTITCVDVSHVVRSTGNSTGWSVSYLLVMRSHLDLSHGLHQCILHRNGNITAGIPVTHLS
jgi:hypothetical protein